MPKLDRHKQLVVERRQGAIGEMYCRGFSQMRIANELNISQTLVSRDLRACRKRWRTELADNWDEAVAQEIAKIDQLERDAREAYIISCRDTVTKDIQVEKAVDRGRKKGKEAGSGVGEGAEATKGQHERHGKTLPVGSSAPEVAGQCTAADNERTIKDELRIVKLLKKKTSRSNGAGDVRWLELAFKCIETRLKLLGALGKEGISLTFNQQGSNIQGGLASLGWKDLYTRLPADEEDPIERQIKEMEDKVALVQSGVPVVDESVEDILKRHEQDKLRNTLKDSSND